MRIIWKKVKYRGFKGRYLVSNYGEVRGLYRNTLLKPTNDLSGGLSVCLHKNENIKRIVIHKLVFQHFKKKELDKKKWVHHLDFNKENNHSPNLNQKSRGDYLRLWNAHKNRVRGVYKWKMTNKGIEYQKWRAVVKHKNKVKTIGYFDKKQEAEKAFCVGYKKIYGFFPYTNRFLEYNINQ